VEQRICIERKPYKKTPCTFEDCCREKEDIDRTYAHRLIGASEVRMNLLPIGNTPYSEFQIRPSASLEPIQQCEAWKEAVESQPHRQAHGPRGQGVAACRARRRVTDFHERA
jgi:hypothetical protein